MSFILTLPKQKNNKYVVKVVLRDKVDYVSGFIVT